MVEAELQDLETKLAILHHIILHRLRQEKWSREGIHAKRLEAGLDKDYLQRVLNWVNWMLLP